MGNIVILRDNGVQQFWSDEAVLYLNLRGEMAHDNDGWLIGSE